MTNTQFKMLMAELGEIRAILVRNEVLCRDVAESAGAAPVATDDANVEAQRLTALVQAGPSLAERIEPKRSGKRGRK
jgi:hypothetical protein